MNWANDVGEVLGGKAEIPVFLNSMRPPGYGGPDQLQIRHPAALKEVKLLIDAAQHIRSVFHFMALLGRSWGVVTGGGVRRSGCWRSALGAARMWSSTAPGSPPMQSCAAFDSAPMPGSPAPNSTTFPFRRASLKQVEMQGWVLGGLRSRRALPLRRHPHGAARAQPAQLGHHQGRLVLSLLCIVGRIAECTGHGPQWLGSL